MVNESSLSGGEVDGGTPGIHGALELLERATERGIPWNGVRRDERESRAN